MKKLLESLQLEHPRIRFTAGKAFYWSPETDEVYYKLSDDNEHDKWTLLHETAHALLGHRSYSSDIELLKLEVAAWQKAEELAARQDITISADHIQDCLDTYRDWLHARSICPTCTTHCLQRSADQYRCHNCHTSWRVSASRFCRPYRSVRSTRQTGVVFAETA